MTTITKKPIRQLADQKTAGKSNPFIDFFENASLKEKREVFNRVIKGANQDQRKILKEYDKKFGK